MKRKEALALAIDIMHKEHNRLLFGSDSLLSDQKRIQINKAIELLDSMRRQREMKL